MKGPVFKQAVVAFCAAAFLAVAAHAEDIDFSKVDRRIAKLPTLTAAQPLYGLFLFGPKGETRVWAVVDKSKAASPVYDVLYLDLNADGDLTALSERFTGKPEGSGRMAFEIGNFTEPGASRAHTEFKITWTRDRTSYRMKWLGGQLTQGPYPTDSNRYLNLAHTPQDAPIFVPGNDGPFRFQHWLSGTLQRTRENDFRVFIGNPGSVAGAFSCVDDKFLPASDYVVATIIYKDTDGKEHRDRFDLKSRC
ncbi:MAG: hypothetical protein AB1705_24580 [Verrucomicrobiota bacterium]